MEIRDPVHGSIEISNSEVQILDTPEYQRLRAIKQLGFSEFSFPAATHNRYLHSIGVCHLAGRAFDHIFSSDCFSSVGTRSRLRQCFRLAALLHDVGHGPLSHVTEEVMPPLEQLKVGLYKFYPKSAFQLNLLEPLNRKATHEDYTIKYLTDSPLADELRRQFPDITPHHIACLIDKMLVCPDDFFIDKGLDYRPILSQLVSSELDVDRIDYLARDSYFCGVNYGNIDSDWLLGNLLAHQVDNQIFLGLSRRAIYTFDDFLLSRHHMNLMVYFHHKSVIYEEMLIRYLTSPDCSFQLPSDINEYTRYNDYRLFEHLAESDNEWAKRVTTRKAYRNLVELHNATDPLRAERIHQKILDSGMHSILASSHVRLSKYHTMSHNERALKIFVVDPYDLWEKPVPIEQSTKIFQNYEGARVIDRIYVSAENYEQAKKIIS